MLCISNLYVVKIKICCAQVIYIIYMWVEGLRLKLLAARFEGPVGAAIMGTKINRKSVAFTRDRTADLRITSATHCHCAIKAFLFLGCCGNRTWFWHHVFIDFISLPLYLCFLTKKNVCPKWDSNPRPRRDWSLNPAP